MPQARNFVIVGLTGGIASGKSTVAKMLAEMGAHIIDADSIAREVVAPGQPALAEIRREFGDRVLRPDQTLDRAALGEVVFADQAARRKLEAITHPRIAQRMMERAAALHDQGHDWVIYDAALLVENGVYRALDSLIVVAARPDVQKARLIERDGLSPEHAQRRIDAQMPLADKVAVADYVIDNDATLDETRAQVEGVYTRIERMVRERGTAKPAHQWTRSVLADQESRPESDPL